MENNKTTTGFPFLRRTEDQLNSGQLPETNGQSMNELFNQKDTVIQVEPNQTESESPKGDDIRPRNITITPSLFIDTKGNITDLTLIPKNPNTTIQPGGAIEKVEIIDAEFDNTIPNTPEQPLQVETFGKRYFDAGINTARQAVEFARTEYQIAYQNDPRGTIKKTAIAAGAAAVITGGGIVKFLNEKKEIQVKPQEYIPVQLEDIKNPEARKFIIQFANAQMKWEGWKGGSKSGVNTVPNRCNNPGNINPSESRLKIIDKKFGKDSYTLNNEKCHSFDNFHVYFKKPETGIYYYYMHIINNLKNPKKPYNKAKTLYNWLDIYCPPINDKGQKECDPFYKQNLLKGVKLNGKQVDKNTTMKEIQTLLNQK
jgi:hypothetical protein